MPTRAKAKKKRPKEARVATPTLDPKTKICKALDCSKPAEVRGHCRLHFLRLLKGRAEGSGRPEGSLSLVDKAGNRRHGNRYRGPDSAPSDSHEVAEKVEALQMDAEDLITDAEEVLKGFGYNDNDTGT